MKLSSEVIKAEGILRTAVCPCVSHSAPYAFNESGAGVSFQLFGKE